MGLLVGPIYIAEIAPASVRSFLGHSPQVMIATGMMTAYIMEAALIRVQSHIGWRLIIGVSALPTLAFTALACCIPDSPCWLVMLGKVDSARQLLEDCRGPKKDDDDDSDEEDDDEVDARMKQLNRVAGFELYCMGNNVAGAPRRIIGFIEVLQDVFDEDLILGPMIKTTLLLVVQEAIFQDLVFNTLGAALLQNGVGCCLASAIA
ncbi:Probable polyol transporter 4 [Linum grandiflorum]